MRKLHVMAIVAALLFSLVAACAPASGGSPASTPAPASGSKAKAEWEVEWDKTVAAARSEGKVIVYSGYGAEFRLALAGPLKDKYGIDLELVTGRSAEIAERVMREQNSGTYAGDVLNVGISQFQLSFWPAKVPQPLKSAIVLPEVLDPKAWWEGRVPWVDKDETVFQMFAYANVPIAINTDMVKAGEISSYKDLLDPRWKGKIAVDDPTISGPGQQLFTMIGYKLVDWNYIEALLKQEPVVTRDRALEVEWISRGKYPVIIGIAPEQFVPAIKAGAPVKMVAPSEGMHVTPGFGALALAKGAPHPNAAKVFINFLLSKEGQTLAGQALGVQSARVDVPTGHLLPEVVRATGGKYISTTSEEFLAKEVELKKKVTDLFAPLIK